MVRALSSSEYHTIGANFQIYSVHITGKCICKTLSAPCRVSPTGVIGGSPPTSRKFAHFPHLENFPTVDSPHERLIPPTKG